MSDVMIHNKKVKARKVSMTELRELPDPQPLSDQHNPIPHHKLIETLEDRVKEILGATIEKRDLAVGHGKNYWHDKGKPGMKDGALFATLTLDKQGPSGTAYVIGVRQAVDRSMSIQMIAGLNVRVCDNGLFYGDTTILQEKHLKSLDLSAEIDLGLGTIKDKFRLLTEGVAKMREKKISDEFAGNFIFQTFLAGLLPAPKFYHAVAAEWAKPRHDEFKPRTMWSLNNAFTEVMKELPPTTRTEKTQELSAMMDLGGKKKKAA